MLLKNLGKLLQGGALIFSTVITTGNTKSHPIAKGSIAFLGGMELAFFFWSLSIPSREEELSALADIVGSAGSILRCVDDDEWGLRAISETMGSEALVLGVMAKRGRGVRMASMTEAFLVVSGVASAGTDLGCSTVALKVCTDCVRPKYRQEGRREEMIVDFDITHKRSNSMDAE